MRKKIFLAAYINVINAQNINCKSIATHIDKDKYEVQTLTLGDDNIPDILGVRHIIVSTSFYKTSNLLAFLRGVLWADIIYVPKHQSTPRLSLKIANMLGKKIFATIEGNMCDTSKKNMIRSFGKLSNMRNYFSLIPNLFGITSNIIVNANCGIKLSREPLLLGVERQEFHNKKTKSELRNIVFIGSLVETKNINQFIRLASFFPGITFNIVGDGPIKEYLESISTLNILFHKKLNHIRLSVLLKNMDLHFLPSISEGFPKVILESASASIPSIVYDSYGANSWINNNEDGFVLSKFDDVRMKVQELIDNPDLLRRSSEGAYKLSEKFDWKNVIKDWEKVIENLK